LNHPEQPNDETGSSASAVENGWPWMNLYDAKFVDRSTTQTWLSDELTVFYTEKTNPKWNMIPVENWSTLIDALWNNTWIAPSGRMKQSSSVTGTKLIVE
jgi:hypothetical protein